MRVRNLEEAQQLIGLGVDITQKLSLANYFEYHRFTAAGFNLNLPSELIKTQDFYLKGEELYSFFMWHMKIYKLA